MVFNLAVIVIMAILISTFAISNSGPVTVSLVFYQVKDVSLAIVILVSVLSGIIFAGILGLYQKVKDGIRIYRLESELKQRTEQDTPQINN